MSDSGLRWEAECKVHRQTLACIAEELGFSGVRQANDELVLPSREALLEALETRKRDLNLNDRVWVKLTEYGKQTYAEYCYTQGRTPDSGPLGNGWHPWTFWILMKNLAHGLTAGGPALIERQSVYFYKPKPEHTPLKIVSTTDA